jgi:hypothetical protein
MIDCVCGVRPVQVFGRKKASDRLWWVGGGHFEVEAPSEIFWVLAADVPENVPNRNNECH